MTDDMSDRIRYENEILPFMGPIDIYLRACSLQRLARKKISKRKALAGSWNILSPFVTLGIIFTPKIIRGEESLMALLAVLLLVLCVLLVVAIVAILIFKPRIGFIDDREEYRLEYLDSYLNLRHEAIYGCRT